MTGSHEDNALEELDLLAYADGLLDSDPARRAEMERRLRADPELAARVEAYRGQPAALRRAYGARAQEPVPERLLAVLEEKPVSAGRRGAGIAAVVALMVCAGAAGWFIGRGEYPGSAAEREFVARSYQDYVTHGDETGIARAGQDAPLDWLSGKISLSLRAPDLTGQGYSLVDAQAVEDRAGEGMIRLTYASGKGQSFSLFLYPRWQAKNSREVLLEREGDVSLAYWLDGPLASVIASRLPPGETMALSQAVRRQLKDRDATRPELSPGREPSNHPAGNVAGGTALPGNGALPQQKPGAPGGVKETPGVVAN